MIVVDAFKSESLGRVMVVSFARWGRHDAKYKKIFLKIEPKSLQIAEKAFIDIIRVTGEDPKPTTLYMWWVEHREQELSKIDEIQRRILRECLVQFLYQFSRGKLNDKSYKHDEFDKNSNELLKADEPREKAKINIKKKSTGVKKAPRGNVR